MGLLQLIHKQVALESTNILFRSFLPSALGAPVLRLLGARIGPRARILMPLQLHNTRYRHLTIGSNCHMGRDVFLDLSNPIQIGDDVGISMRVMMITHMDVSDTPLQAYYPEAGGPITIHNGVYIGAGVTILYGVEIGENAVIGAGALIKDSVPPYSVVAGVPGRVIKTLDPSKLHPHPEANSGDLSVARDSAPASAR